MDRTKRGGPLHRGSDAGVCEDPASIAIACRPTSSPAMTHTSPSRGPGSSNPRQKEPHSEKSVQQVEDPR